MIYARRNTATAVSDTHFPASRKWPSICWMLALLLTLCVVRAEGPDDEYFRIFGIVDQADSLSASGKIAPAHQKYVEAQAALMALKQKNPIWNAKVVSYRLNYLAEKVTATSEKKVLAESSATAAAPGSRSETKSPATAATGQVKLLNAGSEPRKILRLHPAVDDKQSVGMTMKTAMAMTMGNTPTPAMKIPAMQMTMDITVRNVATNGDITFDLVMGDAGVVSDPDVMPQIVEAMKASLAGMRGLTGTGMLSDHGFNKGMEMKLPPGANPQTAQTMDQVKESFSNITCPLPDEAVGAGARWEFKTKIKSQGMAIDQTTTYELVSVEDEHITLRSTVVQNAVNQKIQNPAMPGLKVDLSKMTGNGTGSTTFDLAKIMPVTGSVDEHTEMVMGMNMGQQKQAMTMKMDMSIQFTAK